MQAASKEFSTVSFEAVAFDDGADANAWSRKLGLSFPVLATERQVALKFLGLTDSRLGTPQMVYIDRAGVIRAQSVRGWAHPCCSRPITCAPSWKRF